MEGVPFFTELGTIIIVATLLGLFFKKLRQPLILAYIATGIILGASFLDVLSYKEIIATFSELGITFLLFLVGLNLNINVLKEVGKASLVTGLGQIFFTTTLGTLLSLALGFSLIESIYLAIALSFSSTIIIVKLLSDKNELNSLHGKISLGFLLVQDFVAILALMMVSSIGSNPDLAGMLASFFFKGAVFFVLAIAFTKLVLEKIFDHFAQSQELLFLSAISWLMLLGIASQQFGFSIEIGALIAGVTLASIPYSLEISGKIKYLRDFFLVLFFVLMGSQLIFSSLDALLVPSLIYIIFILVGNPLIVISLLLFLGYRGKTAFLSGLSVAQISEFSLVLLALGVKLGHIKPGIAAIITVSAVITIAVSTYLILHSHALYRFFDAFLQRFVKKKTVEDLLHKAREPHYHTVIIGFNRTGKSIAKGLKLKKNTVLVIDFDPAVVKKALAAGFHAIYGDAEDVEIIDYIRQLKPEIVISTTKDAEANDMLLHELGKKHRPLLILLTENLSEVEHLYALGTDLVIVPAVVAGKRITEYVHTALRSKKALHAIQKNLRNELKQF